MAQTLDLAFDSGNLQALRAAVQAYACQAGLPEDRAIDVVLVVHELAANAVRHGAGAGRLRMWSLPEALCCEVEDGGAAARMEKGARSYQEEDDARADPWPYREGHGLWVARKVADRLNVISSTHGTRAAVTFVLPSGPGTSCTRPGLPGQRSRSGCG